MLSILFVLTIIFIFLEIFGYRKYIKSSSYITNLFSPHHFCHYILNKDYSNNKIQIDNNNFRNYDLKQDKSQSLYLSGDCNFFEHHHTTQNTLGYMIEKKGNIKVFNPSCPHYSISHQLNRFIFDLKKNIKPKYLVFSSSVNDSLALLNNNKNFMADYGNFYKPTSALKFPKIKHFYIRYLFFYFSHKYKNTLESFEKELVRKSRWEELNFENYDKMEKNFNKTNVLDILKIIKFLCDEKKIKLIFCTFASKKKEMLKYEHRKQTLKYITSINKIFREFSKKNNIPLIDFENIFEEKEDLMLNKWDYTIAGNNLRCNEILKSLIT